MTPVLTASDRESARPEKCVWGQKTASGIFFENYADRAGQNRFQIVESRQVAQLAEPKTASGARYFGFRYYSASLGRFINRDLLEEQGAWNLYSVLRPGADDPYAGASGVQGTSWQTEWEQAQDRLLSNTSLPHTTQSVTFSGKRNSGLPGASEQNQKTYSANATGHYSQGGAPGTDPKPPNMTVGNPAAGNVDTNIYIYVGNNPINAIDAHGQALWIGAGIGALVGGVIGGGVALLQGRSRSEIAAAATGGFVAGGLIGSGVGYAAGMAKAGAVASALAVSSAAGAGGSMLGNATTQTINNLAKGQSVLKAISNIDRNSVLKSGVIGAAVGLVGGGAVVLTNTVRNSTAALQSIMRTQQTEISAILTEQQTATAVVHQVENQIVAGATAAGNATARAVGATGATGGATGVALDVVSNGAAAADSVLNQPTPANETSQQPDTTQNVRQPEAPRNNNEIIFRTKRRY